MLINRDRLIVNLDLPRLNEQVVRPTRIWADIGELHTEPIVAVGVIISGIPLVVESQSILKKLAE